jgi:hypothetical protein
MVQNGMKNILLVEPDYRSKFPPLGLLRLSTYHKQNGDAVTFVRGNSEQFKKLNWHRIYVSTLFTWELPRTIKTIKYYQKSTSTPTNVFVGGIAATLMPDYIKSKTSATVIQGLIDSKGKIGPGTPAINDCIPDYGLLDTIDYPYKPEDAYFSRITKGCVRKCTFCAVPKLEPQYSTIRSWRRKLHEARTIYGEKRNLVLLDNNILANDGIGHIIEQLRDEGYENGATLNKRKKTVDFNQGIDARLITPEIAKSLSRICVSPLRLAFDYDAVEPHYRRAIQLLYNVGFKTFTNYLIFNFNDSPASLYRRMKVNLEISDKLGIRITGFPMRFVPIDDVNRRYVSEKWHWRYLRGIQCVLLATHGVVSPKTDFFEAAFGKDYNDFLDILSMPDRYIIHREQYKNNGASEWKSKFSKFSETDKKEFLDILAKLNGLRNKKSEIEKNGKFKSLLEHYYPNGEIAKEYEVIYS